MKMDQNLSGHSNSTSQYVERTPFTVIISPEKFRLLPADFYRAKLCDLSEKEGKFDRVFQFTFIIQKGKYKGAFVSGLINKSSDGKHGKIWQIIRAFTGYKLDVFDSLSLSDLIGKECFINVEERVGEAGRRFNAIAEYVHIDEFKNLKRYSPAR